MSYLLISLINLGDLHPFVLDIQNGLKARGLCGPTHGFGAGWTLKFRSVL